MNTQSHIELPVEASDLIWMLTKCRNELQDSPLAAQITNLIDGYHITEELRRPEWSAADLDTDLPF